MAAEREYYVYSVTNASRTLYTGVTNDLERRVYEHNARLLPGFTRKYYIGWLVYCKSSGDVAAAIAREKQIKSWSGTKKLAPVESMNPSWRDLALNW